MTADDPWVALAAAHWPATADRLGERWPVFLDTVTRHAARHGLAAPQEVARYLALSFAFGPSFETRPQHEWALALLADERLPAHVKLHQLVRRALVVLRQSGGDAAALQRADAALLDEADRLRRAADADAPPLPRVACDIEAFELRVLETGWRHEYQPVDGRWQRVAGPAAPPPLRADAAHPAPPSVTLLSQPAARGALARLQLRQVAHGGCDGKRHPAIRWLGPAGVEAWHGHAAKAASWPVAAPLPQPPATGLGCAIAEETGAAVLPLELPGCGLRDEGVPFGPQALQVHAYPAEQWLWTLQREPADALHWPAGTTAAATPASRCHVERDGIALDARGWQRGFDDTLATALRQGLDALFAGWQQAVHAPAMQARPALLAGRAALTWGWREGAGGLADAPLLRVAGELDLRCGLALELDGEVELHGARARLHLACSGDEPLRHTLRRESAAPGLLETVTPALHRWRWPFTIAADPIAGDDGLVWHQAGPCSGAILGEAGLRPRLSGGSGWQWTLKLAIEPVLAPVTLHDPLLGRTRRQLALLPAATLVDWSLG